MSAAPQAVFDGLRVLDFSEGMAGPMAAMVFADNGADVVKVESNGGDWARSSPGFLMWNRNKRGFVLDLDRDTDRATCLDLIDRADVVIESFGPQQEQAVRLREDHTRRNPALVWCTVSAFGSDDPLEHAFPYESLVVAKTGRVAGNDRLSGSLHGGRPVFLAAPIASYGAAMQAVQGVVAALMVRRRSGSGQWVRTSLADGLTAATMRLAFERRGEDIVPVKARGEASSLVMRGIEITFMTARCADGRFIQMCARQDHHFKNWFAAMELSDLLDDERFRQAPLGLRRSEDADALEEVIRERMALRTQSEWMELFRAWDVGADPFLTPEEFLHYPQMTLNHRVVEIEDPKWGPVRQIGPLAVSDELLSTIGTPAPSLGQHQGELDTLWTDRRATERTSAGEPHPADAPLAGTTIIEAASYLAAPLGATLLAELGARVIKIEPLTGDAFRRVGLEVVHVLHGKESLALDLTKPEGREVVSRLAAIADGFIQNFRPGVAERLGIDASTIRRINPSIVYLNAASYGSHGPEAARPAFHSTPNALSGGGIVQAGTGNDPVDDSYPDPCAGLAVGTALALGLYARQQTGGGSHIETTMLCSTGYVHSERLTRYAGAPEIPPNDRAQRGLHALQRLYRCRRGWLALCVVAPEQWTALHQAIPRLAEGEPDELVGPGMWIRDDDRLTALLDETLAQGDASTWEADLLQAGVPVAAVAESVEEFFVQHGLAQPAEHRDFGSYWRIRPRVRFSHSASRLAPPCGVGEHTRALLDELGYDEDTVAALIASEVISCRES